MSKNILIRNLTKEQSDRLLLLQKKFGVKTNTQALLLLLQFCVILDDELSDLSELYNQLARESFYIVDILTKNEMEYSNIELITKQALYKCQKFKYLLNLRKGKMITKQLKT
jgi:hypothetical protein